MNLAYNISRNNYQTIKIWNLTENILKGILIGHQDIISAVDFFCYDKIIYLVSASLDKKK